MSWDGSEACEALDFWESFGVCIWKISGDLVGADLTGVEFWGRCKGGTWWEVLCCEEGGGWCCMW